MTATLHVSVKSLLHMSLPKIRAIVVLLCLSLVFPACTLPPMSVFVGKSRLTLPGNGLPCVRAGEDLYFLTGAYTTESLTKRLADSAVVRVDIHLSNGLSAKSDSASLQDSLLSYWVEGTEHVTPVDSVQRIVVYGRIPWEKAKDIVPAQAFVWTLLASVHSLGNGEQFDFTAATIGAVVGATVGVLVTTSYRDKEAILFQGFAVEEL